MLLTHIKICGLCAAFLSLISAAARAGTHKITGTPENRIADQVLKTLLSSPLGRTMPDLHYQVILLNELEANAYSQHGGTVYITGGLFPVFEGDKGVWAAVIGHELGHVLLAHPGDVPRFQAALQKAYTRAHAQGTPLAALPPHQIWWISSAKDQEFEADFIGLMLMAEAGYQPGYAVILEKRLLFGLGDRPGFVVAFSHHPRMESREEQTLKFSETAMAVFRSRWPDAVKSPGGNLPPYGTIGRWTFEQENGGERLVFQVPFQVHRAAGMKIRVAAFFLDHDQRVRSSEAKYGAIDGSLVLNSFFNGSQNESSRATLEVSVRALATRHRHLLAVVFLMAGSRPLDIAKRRVDLSGVGH